MKQTIFLWIYKFIEILLCAIFGYACYWILYLMFNNTISVIGVSIIFYFWGNLIRPYFKEMQEYIFDEIKNEK